MGSESTASEAVTVFRWLALEGPSRRFALSIEERELARLEWERPSGSLAVASSGRETWTLKRLGFLQPSVTVRPRGAPTDLARLQTQGTHHRISLANGQRFEFRRAGLLVPAWELRSMDGRRLVHIEPVRDGRRLIGAGVEVDARFANEPALLLLLVLTFYFLVMAWAEDELISAWTDHAEGRW